MTLLIFPVHSLVYNSNIHKPFDPRSFKTLDESSYPGLGSEGGFMVKGRGVEDKQGRRKVDLRRRFMSEAHVERVVNLVRTWPALPMTWEDIRSEIGRVIYVDDKKRPSNAVWTRQALSRNERIKAAYDTRKVELEGELARATNRKRGPRGGAALLLQRQVDQLKIRISDLEKEVAIYEDQIRTIKANIFRGATTEDELLRALPTKIDRRPKDD